MLRARGPARDWAETALEERGVRALRLIQGVINLTRLHPKERVLAATRIAITHRLFRYKALPLMSLRNRS